MTTYLFQISYALLSVLRDNLTMRTVEREGSLLTTKHTVEKGTSSSDPEACQGGRRKAGSITRKLMHRAKVTTALTSP